MRRNQTSLEPIFARPISWIGMGTATPILALASTLALTLAIFLPAPAFAHGDAQQAQPRQAMPMHAETTAFGRPGKVQQASRTVTIDMTDTMRFTPDRIEITAGETVRFTVRNSGKIMHEMVIGTVGELREHAELMRRFPNMEHDAPHLAHVAPGQSGEIVWQFTQPGEFGFACLMPGHLEAGMTGTIIVRKK